MGGKMIIIVNRLLVDYLLLEATVLTHHVHHHLDRVADRPALPPLLISTPALFLYVILRLEGVPADHHPIHIIIVLNANSYDS
jgi:hypothetical protein